MKRRSFHRGRGQRRDSRNSRIPVSGALLLAAGLLGAAGCERPGRAEPAEPPRPAPLRLRVLTWNIHHGEGLDERIDLHRIAAVIREQEPDLVALQEVDQGTSRAQGVAQANELASLLGMETGFAPALPWSGGEYGLAILSRRPFEMRETVRLPNDEGYEPRVAAAADVEVEPGRRIRFVATHLTHVHPPLRLRQAEALQEAFATSELPIILAGDLNATPDSPELLSLGSWILFADGDGLPTIPADDPVRRIDYIGIDRRHAWKILGSWVPDERTASDHRPVAVDLEWTP